MLEAYLGKKPIGMHEKGIQQGRPIKASNKGGPREASNRVTMHFRHTSIYRHTGMQAYSMPRYTGMQACLNAHIHTYTHAYIQPSE